MKGQELKQYKKATALNAIRKIYDKLYKHKYTFYEGEGTLMEQRDADVKRIIEQLEKELNELKQ